MMVERGGMKPVCDIAKENEYMRHLLSELVDPDDCRYDHHGYCQSHSLHNAPCPHSLAKSFLGNKTLDATQIVADGAMNNDGD